MCYPLPGPRCSDHAFVKLRIAKEALKKSRTFENFEQFKNAQKEYDSTPTGQRKLKSIIQKSKDPEEIKVLTQRLEEGARQRAEAMEAYRASVKASKDSLGIPLPAIIVPPINFVPRDEFISGVITRGVEYSYTFYGETYQCEDDDESRMTYEGLSIESVNVDEVLSSLFKTRNGSKRLPKEIKDYAIEIGIDKFDSYHIDVISDVYGETVAIRLGRKKLEELQKYYYGFENAEDKDGVLSYCRSKGVSTQGCAPLEALKKQLRTENHGLMIDIVEERTQVSRETVDLANVRISHPSRYEEVEEREPSSPVLGVLVHHETSHGYRLIDGYHRLKFQKTRGKTSGVFFVLS